MGKIYTDVKNNVAAIAVVKQALGNIEKDIDRVTESRCKELDKILSDSGNKDDFLNTFKESAREVKQLSNGLLKICLLLDGYVNHVKVNAEWVERAVMAYAKAAK